MKKVTLYILVLIGFLVLGCNSDNDPDTINYEFEATVLGKGIDCGSFLVNLSKKNGDSDIKNGTYYANDLPVDLQVKGYKIKLNCRRPTQEENYACTTLGPGYFHLIVLESEQK